MIAGGRRSVSGFVKGRVRNSVMYYVGLAAAGLLAGVLGGMLGVGGSVAMIPVMVSVCGRGPDGMHVYQAAAMTCNFFVAAPAALQHRRAGVILGPIVTWLVPMAAVGGAVGVTVSNLKLFSGEGQALLAGLFGIFLFYVAGINIYRMIFTKDLPDVDEAACTHIRPWRTALLVGFPMGCVAGLLGIGGGALAVPLQQIFLKIPLRRAIGNSTVTIAVISLFNAAYKNVTLDLLHAAEGFSAIEALRLTAVLVPTAVLGGLLGGRLTHLLPQRLVSVAFIMLMLYAGYDMTARGVSAYY